MMSVLKRLLVGACCALLLVALVAAVEAAPPLQDSSPVPGSDECVGCHEGLRSHWEDSVHGQAATNPDFVAAWEQEGSPNECLQCHTTGFDPATGTYDEAGVGCLTCHSPIVADHPDQYMPTDVSSRLCGTCHLETFTEWQISNHGKEDLACSNCHNPHTTELREGSVQHLCETCHKNETHFYALTAHAEEGLLCTDCHLRVSEAPLGEGHGQREHTFGVDLGTCNRCHESDMHAATTTGEMPLPAETDRTVACYPEGVVPSEPTAEPEVAATPPQPMNPIVFVVPAGIGLVFGALLTPWVEGVARKRKGEK